MFFSIKKIDVLLLARPDHSYSIYEKLLEQNKINYLYCCFKLLPLWSKKMIKSPRVRYYSKGYSNCFLLTFFHLARLKMDKPKWEKYEKFLFQLHLKLLLPFIKPSLVHYWPNYTMEIIRKYKKRNPDVKTFADVYFPCEQWVIDNIKPLFEKYNLEMNMSKIERDAEKLKELMQFEDNFIVPSPFVADTYRQYYPDKNYILKPYGITKWNGYKKKSYKNDSNEIKSFVYAGGSVTIEKGCDLLLEFFKNHPELELHVYGTVPTNQKSIFKVYENLSNINYHGLVPKSELQAAFSGYDVGIHLSQYDAYSISVGELLGAGLPVIVSDKTGILYQVKEHKLGLVSSMDMESVCDRVSEITTPEVYNNILDNLDAFLNAPYVGYGDSIVAFYKEQIQD